jgi:CubicO group peptidase (beta-lactamase class C family)
MSTATAADQQPSTAAETDPQILGWMQGFPPAPDRTITFQDGSFRSFPELRWAWSNIRQLVPTVNVWRGPGPASVLPREDHDIGASKSVTMDGRPMTFAKMLEETYADGIAVLHRGKLIYERYFGALKPHKPHIAMSVTKSFTGTLAGILVAEGKIDPQAPITDYVPELKGSAFGDARVHEAMDMTTGLVYTEIYADKNSDVWGLRRANGMAPIEPGYEGATNIFDFLRAQQKQGEHGRAFAYKTVNSDVLAWICRRASGLTLSDLLSERIWIPMGAEEDAHYHVDRICTESGGGGLSTTLRDLARFGETIRNHGRFNGRQIAPSHIVEDIARGGDPGKFKPAGYHIARRVLPQSVVGDAQRAWRLHGARRSRPGHLYRSEGRDGDRAVCVAPGRRQCRQRSRDAAGVYGAGEGSDGGRVKRGRCRVPIEHLA